MKRIYIITIMTILCSMAAMAQNRPDMAHQTNGGNRYEEMTSLSVPVVSLLGNKLAVTNITGSWTMWITDEFGAYCVYPRTYYGPQNDISVSIDNNEEYVLTITTSAGITYRWHIDGGFIYLYGCGDFDSIVSPKSTQSVGAGLSKY